MKKVAIIGATGMLGLPVVAALLDLGFEVTALVRSPDKARLLLPPAVQLVAADVRDPGALRQGLGGCDAVYCNLSVTPNEKPGDFHTEGEGLDNILEASRQAGIDRVGYLSALIQDGAEQDWWVMNLWRHAVSRVKTGGIPYTIFYPSNVMETLAQKHVAGPLVLTAGRGQHANYWIAGADYGRQVARSFLRPGRDPREYVVQGPEGMTYDEAVHRFARALRQPRRVLKTPLVAWRALGLVSRTMDFNYHITSAILAYPEVFRAEHTWAELGRPTVTIEEFARSL
jgi:uncharacterized protein YbjT (DUF2867 family)